MPHTGDVSQVLDLLEDNCIEVDAVSGSRKEGKQDIMKMMEGVNKARPMLCAIMLQCAACLQQYTLWTCSSCMKLSSSRP